MGGLPMGLLLPLTSLKALNLSGNHLDNVSLFILTPISTLQVSEGRNRCKGSVCCSSTTSQSPETGAEAQPDWGRFVWPNAVLLTQMGKEEGGGLMLLSGRVFLAPRSNLNPRERTFNLRTIRTWNGIGQ